jgi:hypothetical protein
MTVVCAQTSKSPISTPYFPILPQLGERYIP